MSRLSLRILAWLAIPALAFTIACDCGGDDLTKEKSGLYSIGGTVIGLEGELVLQNNGGDSLRIDTEGSFKFATKLPSNTPYNVSVYVYPATQSCVVNRASGLVEDANVASVEIVCGDPTTTGGGDTYTVGGNVSGLKGTLIIRNNGKDNLTIDKDGAYIFPTGVADGETFGVTVLSEPFEQTCTVNNGVGYIDGADITDVDITCVDRTYTVSGQVIGITGDVILQNNGGDDLVVSSEGGFTFTTPLPVAVGYAVTVKTPPFGQICSVINGFGQGGMDVNDVTVACIPVVYTVGGIVTGYWPDLILQVNGGTDLTIEYDGPFTFLASFNEGDPYDVTVLSKPNGMDCVISNGSGTVSGASVINVLVDCKFNIRDGQIKGSTPIGPFTGASARVDSLAGKTGYLYTNKAGIGSEAELSDFEDVATDGKFIYYTAYSQGCIWKMDTKTLETSKFVGQCGSYSFKDGDGDTAQFYYVNSLTISDDGKDMYVSDMYNYRVRHIDMETREVSTVAGGGYGMVDGVGTAARFYYPTGLSLYDRTLYVADQYNCRVRQIDLDSATVSSVTSGSPYASTDGPCSSARFYYTWDVAVDDTGNEIYVADYYGQRIRKITLTPSCTVSTVAGNGSYGITDGSALSATFRYPMSVMFDGGNVYIGDNSSYSVRLLSGGNVSTIAGVSGSQGTADGLATSEARIAMPRGYTTNGTWLIIGDSYYSNHNRIRALKP